MNFKSIKNQIKPQPEVLNVVESQYELNPIEIEVILRLIHQTTFPVKDIEVLYKTIIKLQEQYKLKTTNAN